MGRENILVVDSGATQTQIVPIIEGNIVEKAIVRSDIAGEYLTEKLYDIWST